MDIYCAYLVRKAVEKMKKILLSPFATRELADIRTLKPEQGQNPQQQNNQQHGAEVGEAKEASYPAHCSRRLHHRNLPSLSNSRSSRHILHRMLRGRGDVDRRLPRVQEHGSDGSPLRLLRRKGVLLRRRRKDDLPSMRLRGTTWNVLFRVPGSIQVERIELK
jgi:hypothetical protein